MSASPPSDRVREQLRSIIGNLVVLKGEMVRNDSLLVDELALDSLGFLELSIALEEAFGISFPDLKASEEIFVGLLPEALQKLEVMPGGRTLFEYIKEEAVRDVLRSLPTVGDLGAVAELPVPATLDARAPLHTLSLHDLERFGGLLGDGARDEQKWAARLEQGFDTIGVTELLATDVSERLFRRHTTATLAEAVGARVPRDIDPAAPVSTLRLGELFRFLTVETMARYVTYLVETAR